MMEFLPSLRAAGYIHITNCPSLLKIMGWTHTLNASLPRAGRPVLGRRSHEADTLPMAGCALGAQPHPRFSCRHRSLLAPREAERQDSQTGPVNRDV